MKIELDEIMLVHQELRFNEYNIPSDITKWNEDFDYYIKIKNEFRLKYKVNANEFIYRRNK